MREGPCAAVAPVAYDAVVSRAPSGVRVLELSADTDLARVDFLVPRSGDRRLIAGLPDQRGLCVLQALSAGTDWVEDLVPPQATLCSARGARDGPVAEWVLAALLGTSSGLLESARDREWRSGQLEDLGAWHVVIVGMGSIGATVADRLRAFGSRTTGVVSKARDGLRGVDELPKLLPSCDALVVLTPLTEATRHLFDGAALAALPDRALVINAARGPVIDPEALLAEVSTGRLRAVLDVTDPEPLPQGHPLWEAPGVLSITPHLAGDSPAGHARAAALAGDQLARWCRGEELLNVVRGPARRRRADQDAAVRD